MDPDTGLDPAPDRTRLYVAIGFGVVVLAGLGWYGSVRDRWRTEREDAERTTRIVDVAPLALDADPGVEAIVVYDVFGATGERRIVALDDDHHALWKTDVALGDWPPDGVGMRARRVVVSAGTVVLAGGFGKGNPAWRVGLDAATGAVKWRVERANDRDEVAALGVDGDAVIELGWSRDATRVERIDAGSGAAKWTVDVPKVTDWRACRDGVALAAPGENTWISLGDGATRPDPPGAPMVDAEGRCSVLAAGGQVYTVDDGGFDVFDADPRAADATVPLGTNRGRLIAATTAGDPRIIGLPVTEGAFPWGAMLSTALPTLWPERGPADGLSPDPEWIGAESTFVPLPLVDPPAWEILDLEKGNVQPPEPVGALGALRFGARVGSDYVFDTEAGRIVVFDGATGLIRASWTALPATGVGANAPEVSAVTPARIAGGELWQFAGSRLWTTALATGKVTWASAPVAFAE